MQLSDIMSNAGLSGYAVIALVIFFVAFLAVVAVVMWPSNRKKLEKAGRIPLDDGEPPSPPPGGGA